MSFSTMTKEEFGKALVKSSKLIGKTLRDFVDDLNGGKPRSPEEASRALSLAIITHTTCLGSLGVIKLQENNPHLAVAIEKQTRNAYEEILMKNDPHKERILLQDLTTDELVDVANETAIPVMEHVKFLIEQLYGSSDGASMFSMQTAIGQCVMIGLLVNSLEKCYDIDGAVYADRISKQVADLVQEAYKQAETESSPRN